MTRALKWYLLPSSFLLHCGKNIVGIYKYWFIMICCGMLESPVFCCFRDVLLLETGFLTILVAPLNLQIPVKRFRLSFYHPHDGITLWLVRWLLFRLMFSSGVVKLTSRCPTWWGLTGILFTWPKQYVQKIKWHVPTVTV